MSKLSRLTPLMPRLSKTTSPNPYIPVLSHISVVDCHVDDSLAWKRPPLFEGHWSPFGSESTHPLGATTQVSWPPMAMWTRINCDGVPTRSVNVDHFPSLPSLLVQHDENHRPWKELRRVPEGARTMIDSDRVL